MQDDLYFIKLLADGVEATDPAKGLFQAFAEIETMGRETRSRRGLSQFQAFMHEAAIAAGAAQETPIGRPGNLDLVLESAGEIRARWHLLRSGQQAFRARVEPGAHVLRLSTGRVLWHAELSPADVLWSHAYPDAALPVAADMGQRRDVLPSLVEEALSGSLTVRVYPGLKTGSLEVTVQC
jgi:hypothetical protein